MSRATQDTTTLPLTSDMGLSPAMAILSSMSSSLASCDDVVLQPHHGIATTMVWALPRSLATTWGIIVIFSSCGY